MTYNVPSLFLLSVNISQYVEVYPGESISVLAEAIAVESKKVFVVEETVVQKEEKKAPLQINPEPKIFQPERERDDDWFLLLDVVSRETSDVPPGTHRVFFFFTHRSSKKLTNELRFKETVHFKNKTPIRYFSYGCS